jgi:Lon protease-like protein
VSETLTLSSLPLFPLGTVLFPDGVLPLRIFEVRYLDMIGKCHKAGAPFGVVTLAQGAEVRRPGGGAEVFYSVGTLATITALQTPQPGLMTIRCHGEQRFRISRFQRNSSTACGSPMSGGWRRTSPSRSPTI